jgi:hypothetical protein
VLVTSARETLADARRLRQVEVAAAALWDGSQAFELFFVRRPHGVARQRSNVMKPAQDDEAADLEHADQATVFRRQVATRAVLGAKGREGDQELRGDPCRAGPDWGCARL